RSSRTPPLQRIRIVVETAVGSPSKASMLADWSALAMQLPIPIPMNGPPVTDAVVTRPDGAKTTRTGIEDLASADVVHPDALRAAAAIATAAAARVKCLGAARAASEVGCGASSFTIMGVGATSVLGAAARTFGAA